MLSPRATTKFTVPAVPGRRKTEVKFVKEALEQRLASHAHIHFPDTHGDQPLRLIIQPELTAANVQTVLGTSKNNGGESLHGNWAESEELHQQGQKSPQMSQRRVVLQIQKHARVYTVWLVLIGQVLWVQRGWLNIHSCPWATNKLDDSGSVYSVHVSLDLKTGGWEVLV